MLQHHDKPGVKLHVGTWVNWNQEGRGGTLAHAWAEIAGGIVYEVIGQRFYDKADHHRETRSLPVKSYTAEQTARMLGVRDWQATEADVPAFVDKIVADTRLECVLAISMRVTPDAPAVIQV